MARAFKVIAGLVLILLSLYLIFWWRARPRAAHPFFENLSHFLVIAHQGGDFLWPSNTLFAFQKSVELGVDMLELDVHASKDGALVVIHDDTLERTTNGSGLVKDKALAELKLLDAGYNWSPERKGESFPYRDQGISIPSLKEVFESFPEKPMSIEIKQAEPSINESLCELIRESKMQTKVLINSFHVKALEDFRQLCPEIATATTSKEVRTFFILNTLYLGRLYTPPADAFQIPESQGNLKILNLRFITNAKRKNLNLQIWTINESSEMARLSKMGVDGIITDRPDRLKRVLGQEVGLELPEDVPE